MKNWKLKIVAEYDQQLAHEGPVFNSETQKLFFTSNRLNKKNGSQYVVISQYDPITGITTDLGLRDRIPMANGAIAINSKEIAFTMQGTSSKPAGVAIFNHQTNKTRTLIDDANGNAFNSPNDIILTEKGVLIFTDPSYGYEQQFRPAPELGDWVWSVNLDGENLRMVADGFSKPNGIALDSDRNRVLITDTGYFSGDGSSHPENPRTIYEYKLSGGAKNPLLSHRTVLNIASEGIPDGIKIDQSGNIWTGTAAGVEIFNEHGVRRSTIPIEGGVSNLTFANPRSLYLLGGNQLWRLELKGSLKRNKIIGSHLANTLTGTTNNDLIKGKKGDDIIDAGHGDDDMKGGKGKDRFRLSQGNDRILDYQIGESILVNSKIFGRDLEITQQGADLRISSTTGLNTELLNTDLTAFQETSALEFTNGS